MSTENHRTLSIPAVGMTDSLTARATSFVRHLARVMSDASGIAGVLLLHCTRGGQKRLPIRRL